MLEQIPKRETVYKREVPVIKELTSNIISELASLDQYLELLYAKTSLITSYEDPSNGLKRIDEERQDGLVGELQRINFQLHGNNTRLVNILSHLEQLIG